MNANWKATRRQLSLLQATPLQVLEALISRLKVDTAGGAPRQAVAETADKAILSHIEAKTTFRDFFEAADLNPNAHLITGVICGYRVEEITNEITRKTRYLDKLVDELARGKKMESILRKPKEA